MKAQKCTTKSIKTLIKIKIKTENIKLNIQNINKKQCFDDKTTLLDKIIC